MPDSISNDGALAVGQQLISASGRYSLVMQGDGNLVGYGPGYAFWDSKTSNLPVTVRPTRAVMQGDGNLVLYSASGVPVWASGTQGNFGARLVMQDDRNIVIYSSDGRAIWASNTVYVAATEISVSRAQNVGHSKLMRVDGRLYRSGHLVASVYTRNDNWTGGLRGKALLVVVDEGGHGIWVSQEYAAPTRCSVPDPSCASYGQTTWNEKFPDAVGRWAARGDLYLADTPSYNDLRAELIRIIKGGRDVAQEIKDAWDSLR